MTSSTDISIFDLKRHLGQLYRGVKLGSASTDDLTVAWVEAAEGTHVPSHQHPQSQLTVVLSGRIRVTTPTGTYELSAGQAINIPGDTPHAASITTTAVYLDIFRPARHDLTPTSFVDAKGRVQS